MKLKSLLLGLTTLLCVWGCDHHIVDYAQLSSPDNLKAVAEEGGVYSLEIDARGTWILSSSSAWLVLAATQGEDQGKIQLTVAANTGAQRSGVLTLRSGSAVDTIGVVQVGAANDLTNTIPSRLEVPRMVSQPGYQFIRHAVEYKGQTVENYCMEYNLEKRHARWVAFTAYDLTAVDNIARTDAWADDPELSSEYWTKKEDYKNYDRGHLVASNDRRYCKEANEQTFYYSNMSPQLANFNQKIWQKLEENVKAWTQDASLRDTLYVVKGGTIADDQILTYNGPSNVAVPKYYFMAVLARKGETFQSIAFWLEHKVYSEPYDLKGKAISIADLEKKTGIDFFPVLPDALEQQVEASFNVEKWTWKTQ